MTKIFSKPVLVLLHGWCGNPLDFRFQIDYFSKNYHILTPSYSDLVQGGYGIDQVVIYLSKFLDGYKNIIVIGHSMGGFLGLKLAKLNPYIQKVVVVDTTLNANVSQEQKKLLNMLARPKEEESLKQAIYSKMVNLEFDSLNLMKVKISEMISYWQQNRQAFCSILSQYFYENKQDLFNGLKIDILYISGLIHRATKDELLSFYKQIKYTQINVGHFVMLNSPDQFNKVVNEFLV